MIIAYLVSIFFIGCPNQEDSLQTLQIELAKTLRLSMNLPPEFLAHDTCYHHTDLLKVEVNKSSKVVSINLSDSAPAWLKQELARVIEKKSINYNKLNSAALAAGIKGCTIVFPLILESDYFPCGKADKQRSLGDNYFRFNGKNLQGNIIFGDQIILLWSVRYLYKYKP